MNRSGNSETLSEEGGQSPESKSQEQQEQPGAGQVDPENEPFKKVSAERIERYTAFDGFLNNAVTRFRNLHAKLAAGKGYEKIYGFHVTPGGQNGGKDRTLLEVFYGTRYYDHTDRQQDRDSQNERSGNLQNLAEIGAKLIYRRKDNGLVMCILKPAQTPYATRRETGILFEDDIKPVKLTDTVLKRHLKWLIAYMDGTGLDGLAHKWLRWRFLVITNFRRWRNQKGNWRPAPFVEGCLFISGWVFTIGLGGIAVYFLQRQWPLPDSVTPAVLRSAAQAHQDQLKLNDALVRETIALEKVATSIDHMRVQIDQMRTPSTLPPAIGQKHQVGASSRDR